MRITGLTSLTIAAVGWLLLLLASPAWTYYPPVAATATYTASSLTLGVYNPKTQTGFEETYFLGPGNEFVNLQQQNGVIAWVLRSGTDYYVTCCTYDPMLHASDVTVDQQGPFTSVSQLYVADGLVVYVAGIPPSSGDPTGHSEPRYGTYDPAKQAWQMQGENWYVSGMQIQSMATKDGVVLCQYYWPGMPTPYAFDCWMYDPLLGMWWGSGMDNWDPFVSITIDNASVNYVVKIAGTGDFLYGTFYFLIGSNNGWSLDLGTTPRTTTTLPQAYFVAQPTSGPAHLWVWFTDMSIGGTGWSWNFGDGHSSTSRSTYHTYLSKGTYQAYQAVSRSVPVPVISVRDVTIRVTGMEIGPLLLLLLD